jgi:predicted metal-dependent hydrolase
MLEKLRRTILPPAVEQRNIQLAGTPVTYTLKRSNKRRSIGLRIDDNGLTVNMPLRASEKWLHSVLNEKANWVIEKLGSWQTKKNVAPVWLDGEKLAFRGETFTLRIIPSLFNSPPQLRGEQLLLHVTDISNEIKIEKVVTQWYRSEAERVFQECVAHYAPLMSVAPKQIKLSSARTQWGSCTSRGVVRLNWHLVRMPLHLIDYVVVHELAHLIEMNHSAAFWRIVESACPDYAKCRAELRNYGISE